MATSIFEVANDPDLMRFAEVEAKPLYAAHCASCHGNDMKGNPKIGAPDLRDGVWLYGSGTVFDIDRTLLYGIRAGSDRSHNVSDMTAFGLRGRLSDGEIREVVQYVRQISH